MNTNFYAVFLSIFDPFPARGEPDVPDRTRWNQMESDGIRWNQMESDGIRWNQMEPGVPDGTRWN